MRINSLKIGRFRSLTDLELTFGPGGNILYGLNYVGKSSVLDAIPFALVGACRGTDEAGRGKANLTPDGSPPVVEIDYSHDGSLPAKPVLAAVLEAGRFLDLHPTKQQEIVMALSGGFPANQWGIKSLDDLKARHKAAVERRREIKRDLSVTGGERPEGKEVTREVIGLAEEKLAGYRSRRDVLLKQISAAEASAGVDVPALEKEKAGLERQIKTLEEKAAKDYDAVAAAYEKKTKTLNASYAKAEASERECQAGIDGILSMVNALKDTKAQLEGSIAAVGKLTDTCVLSPAIACKITVKEKRAILGDYQLQLAEVEGKLSEQRKLFEQAEKGMGFLRVGEIREELARLAAPAPAKHSPELVAALRRLAEVEGALKAAGPRNATPLLDVAKAQEELVGLEASIANGDRIIKAARESLTKWESYNRTQDQRQELEKALDDVEALVKALSPDGQLAQAAQAQAQEGFPDLINPCMARFGFTVEISTAPWSVRARGRNPELLSDSERIMASAAIQYALAKLTGINVVLVDRLEALDKARRGALVATIKADPEVQWICAFTVPDESYQPPVIDGVYWINMGVEQMVEA